MQDAKWAEHATATAKRASDSAAEISDRIRRYYLLHLCMHCMQQLEPSCYYRTFSRLLWSFIFLHRFPSGTLTYEIDRASAIMLS